MDDADIRKMVEAILLKRTRSGETLSQAILALLRQFVSRGKFQEFALSYQLYSSMYKPNTAFIQGRAPGIVLNNYVLPNVAGSTKAFRRWEKKHRGWQNEIRERMSDCGRLETYVKKMVAEIEAIGGEAATRSKSRTGRGK